MRRSTRQFQFAALFAPLVFLEFGCGASCSEGALNNHYLDDLNGFEMFLEQSCGSIRVNGRFIDGDDFYDVWGDVIGDTFYLQGDWNSILGLDILEDGKILLGEISTSIVGDQVKVLFRAQP